MAALNSWTKLILYSLHLLIYLIVGCCQAIYWRIVGIQKHLDSCKYGESYETSGQLLKVWSRSKQKLFSVNRRIHFISTHVEFVHPEYALQKHITLMTVTDKEAIFSVPSPNCNLLNVGKWPFLLIAQYEATRFILVLPISSFIRLGDTLGDPKAKIIFIHHTGRCGSTALSQVFNALPKVVSISEPLGIFSLNLAFKYKYFGKWDYDWQDSEEYLSIYRSTIRLLLKPSLKKSDAVAIKSTALTSKLDMCLIPKLFPKFVNIFVYRDSKPQVSSMYNAFSEIDISTVITKLIATNPLLSFFLPNTIPAGVIYICCDEGRHAQPMFRAENILKATPFILRVIMWSELCFHFKETEGRYQNHIVPALKYEHWQSDQDKFLKTLFNCSGLDLTDEHYKLVVKALSQDSQKNSAQSKDNIKQKKRDVTQNMIAEANRYLRNYELPEWGESLTLPNTVTSY